MEVQRSEGTPYFLDQDFLAMARNPDCIFVVLELGRRVVGFISGFVVPTKRSEAIIHSTMVHRDFRRRGIGRYLVEAFAFEAFLGRGVQTIFAEVEAGPDLFYERCNFRKEAVWNSMVLRKERFIALDSHEAEGQAGSSEPNA